MRILQQFDLNLSILKIENINVIHKKLNEIPVLIEKLSRGLIGKGYSVVESSAYYMGVPQSITVMKEFTGPFVTQFSEKVKEDFNAISKALGIDRLFE